MKLVFKSKAVAKDFSKLHGHKFLWFIMLVAFNQYSSCLVIVLAIFVFSDCGRSQSDASGNTIFSVFSRECGAVSHQDRIHRDSPWVDLLKV